MEQQPTETPSAPLTMPIPNLPNTSIPPMPPLGPAPANLPPVIHPPPLNLPTTVLNGSVPSPAEVAPAIDPTVPVQGQFETLSLSTPMEPIPSQMQIPSSDGMNVPVMPPPPPSAALGDAVPPIPVDGEAAVNTEMTDATNTGGK